MRPVTIPVAARRLGVHESTLRRWIKQGAPVAKRGGRGRGKQMLVCPQAVLAWRHQGGDKAALVAFLARVPELVADQVHEAFRLSDGPHKREVAGVLAASWWLVVDGLLQAAGCDAEGLPVPEKVERLREIAQG